MPRLGLTFIFAPYFAGVAAAAFEAQGVGAARAERAEPVVFGADSGRAFVVAFSAPFLGAYADASGRKTPGSPFSSPPP